MHLFFVCKNKYKNAKNKNMKYFNKFIDASTAINAGLLSLPQISMINNDKIYGEEKSEDYIGA